MLVSIGRISKTYGNRGGVILEAFFDVNPADLVGKKLFIAPPLIDKSFVEVEKALVRDKRLILFFCEVRNLYEAKSLVKRTLQMYEQDFKKITSKAKEILSGFEVFTDDGKKIGTVKEDLSYPAHKVLQILRLDGGEIFVPFVDQFVVKVDKKNKKVILSGNEYRKNWEK